MSAESRTLPPLHTLTNDALFRTGRCLIPGARIKATAKVAENLYRKATGEGREAVIAAIFWLKTRAGWKETSVSEIAAAKGSEPVTMIVRQIVEPAHRPQAALNPLDDDIARPLIEHR